MDSARTAVRPLTAVDARSPAQVGRHARLELRFAVRRGRTELVHAYAEPPLRVGRTFAEGAGVHMILASAAPGIFGGDRFTQHIIVEEGAAVRLTSQSALQVHPSVDGHEATIDSDYQVHAQARLVCTWDPIIPFADARLSQRITLDIESGGALFWSDAFMAGREARQERWAFDTLAYELQLRRAGRLSYLERYRLQPSDRQVTGSWVAGDASYFGSVLSCGVPPKSVLELSQQQLNAVTGARGAIDQLEDDLLLVRLMSASGAAFHRSRRIAHDELLRPQPWAALS